MESQPDPQGALGQSPHRISITLRQRGLVYCTLISQTQDWQGLGRGRGRAQGRHSRAVTRGAGLGLLCKGAGWLWEGSGPGEHRYTNLPACLARSPSWELEGGPAGWTGERTAGRQGCVAVRTQSAHPATLKHSVSFLPMGLTLPHYLPTGALRVLCQGLFYPMAGGTGTGWCWKCLE